MAIYLVTGTPGAGKTLNTLIDVYNRAKKENRSVYYRGIQLKRDNPHGITFENWFEMPHPDEADLSQDVTPWSWQNAPDGSIILIDEAQYYYPATSPTAKQPPYITDMSTHRHRGFDIYLITQGTDLLSSQIKNWVQPHIHYRNMWGGLVKRKYINEYCINNIRSTREISREAIKKSAKHDTRFYDCYVSATVHTKNKRFPMALLFMMLFAAACLLGGLYYLFDYYEKYRARIIQENQPQGQHYQYKEGPLQNQFNPPIPLNLGESVFKGSGQRESFDPMTAYIPRIEAMPETAPAYDDLRKPQTFPKPQCLISQAKDTCTCYTQQATIMHDYPDTLCREYAKHGYFDPTRKEREPPRYEDRRNERKDTGDTRTESPLQGLIPRDYGNIPPSYYMRSDGLAITANPLR